MSTVEKGETMPYMYEVNESLGQSSDIPLTEVCPDSNWNSPVLEEIPEREVWGNKAEFLLATIGLAVGLGNIWRFPYLCQKNGGGAFLIPFFTFMVIEGIPLFFIELGVGQRFRKTGVEVWRGMHKTLTGIGVSSMIVSYLLCIYYIIVISWCVYYAFLSMTTELPWQKEKCPNYDKYIKYVHLEKNVSDLMKSYNVTRFAELNMAHFPKSENITSVPYNITSISRNHSFDNWTTSITAKVIELRSCCIQDPTQYQWYEKTLMVSKSITDIGIGINTHLLWALALSWLIVYLCLVKGIKSSGKAVYFTATFPYVLLIILFIRGITLPGASDGIKALFTPKFEELWKAEIWMDAATQVFFSLSLGFGALIAFASYNPVNNNIVRDAYIVVLTDCGTALFGGVVVFSILGYRQHVTGIPITKGGYGPGLAFVTFSDVMLLMDVSPLWAILFFFMLILLGIDSEFGTLEGAIAPLYDLNLVKMKKWMFLPIVIGMMFLIDLSMIAGFGYYVFQIFDSYAINIPLLVIAFVQCVAIGWVYGTDKFADDIEFMTGKRPWVVWMFCWKYLSPIAVLVILMWVLVNTINNVPKYQSYIGCPTGDKLGEPWTKDIEYPKWARFIAAIMVIGTLSPIPIFIVKEWPKDWKLAFKKQFCSGIANYMPDPSSWGERKQQNSMIYEAAYATEQGEKN